MIIFAELMVQYKPFRQRNLVRDSCQNVTAGIQQIFQSTGLGTIIVDADIVDYERERGKPVSGAKGTEKAIFQIRSEEHTSELQSLMRISYAVFCLKKKTTQK